MSCPFIDADVIIRLLSQDDLAKQAEAAAPDTVIADAVYVLSSPRLYAKPCSEVAELLTPLVRLPGFRVRNRRIVLRALDLYAAINLDFSDALIVASMERANSDILYSYDTHFDRIPSITRRSPGSISLAEQ